MITKRVRQIGLSPTLKISALAAELRAAGEDVLDFSAGQPDLPTPDRVKQAGIRAIEENQTRYTANQGTVELRQAVADRLSADYGLQYSTDEILVSPGAKASLYFAALALFEPGDEVLVPSPYWVSYPEQIKMAQAEPVFVDCPEDRGFKLTADDLEEAITPKTRALILNYPSNPTGACYSRDELEPLAEVCLRRRIWVIADEIYSKLVYDGRRFTSIAELDPELRARTLIVDGMSKTYSMTGWRIGYAAGPRELIAGMSRLQSHSTSNATSISQWASVEALALAEEQLVGRAEEFQRRRDLLLARLNEMQGMQCDVPEGAFYAFPNVSGCFAGGSSVTCGQELAQYLLEHAKIAVVPGEAFGSKNHIRISYAASLDRINEGMDRVADALKALY